MRRSTKTDLTSQIASVFGSILAEDLRNKELCYRCIMSGMFLQDCLYKTTDMLASPKTGDQICRHCYDNEGDLGHRRNLKAAKGVFELIDAFHKYQGQRLLASTNPTT